MGQTRKKFCEAYYFFKTHHSCNNYEMKIHEWFEEHLGSIRVALGWPINHLTSSPPPPTSAPHRSITQSSRCGPYAAECAAPQQAPKDQSAKIVILNRRLRTNMDVVFQLTCSFTQRVY